eukprot:CAMPEP_0119014006 /NCGR_PEP_ID=MMETSP1176-20130426/9304_1 /TAXON_ID=265551 /ORGANISM="Synedropsis recta cf, Strain CCMP1620" /LENGTH=207 /DNA_ID=CAMNT_0006967139 /DNA_START=172 /DNA_END=795 /DNA_ORIENTATION=+
MVMPNTSLSSSSFALGVIVGLGLYAVMGESWKTKKRQDKNTAAPRRFGSAIKLKPEQFGRYTQLHDAGWPGVLERMSKSNIRNFTIFYHKETSTLFSHFEWIGHWGRGQLTEAEEKALFDADMQAIADDPVTQVWWTECEPCQEPFSQWPKGAPPPSQGGVGNWWAPLVCLNHCGHWATQYGEGLRDPDFVSQNPDGKTTVQPNALE